MRSATSCAGCPSAEDRASRLGGQAGSSTVSAPSREARSHAPSAPAWTPAITVRMGPSAPVIRSRTANTKIGASRPIMAPNAAGRFTASSTRSIDDPQSDPRDILSVFWSRFPGEEKVVPVDRGDGEVVPPLVRRSEAQAEEDQRSGRAADPRTARTALKNGTRSGRSTCGI